MILEEKRGCVGLAISHSSDIQFSGKYVFLGLIVREYGNPRASSEHAATAGRRTQYHMTDTSLSNENHRMFWFGGE